MGILTGIANAVAKKVVGPWVNDWDRKLKLDAKPNLLVLKLGPNLALRPDAINNLVDLPVDIIAGQVGSIEVTLKIEGKIGSQKILGSVRVSDVYAVIRVRDVDEYDAAKERSTRDKHKALKLQLLNKAMSGGGGATAAEADDGGGGDAPNGFVARNVASIIQNLEIIIDRAHVRVDTFPVAESAAAHGPCAPFAIGAVVKQVRVEKQAAAAKSAGGEASINKTLCLVGVGVYCEEIDPRLLATAKRGDLRRHFTAPGVGFGPLVPVVKETSPKTIVAQLGRVFQRDGLAADHPYIPSHFVLAGRHVANPHHAASSSSPAQRGRKPAPIKLLDGVVTLTSTLNPKPEDAQKQAAIAVAVDLDPFTLRIERSQVRFVLELAAKVATFQIFARYHGYRPQGAVACSAPALMDLPSAAAALAAAADTDGDGVVDGIDAARDDLLVAEAAEQQWCAAWWRYALTAVREDVLADEKGTGVDNQPWAVVVQRRIDLQKYVDMYMYKNDKVLYLSTVAKAKGISDRAAKKAHKGDRKAMKAIEEDLSVAEIEMFRTQALQQLSVVRKEKKRLDEARAEAAKAAKVQKKQAKKAKAKAKPNLFRWGKRVLKKTTTKGGSASAAGAGAAAEAAASDAEAAAAAAAASDADDEFATTLQNMFEGKMAEDDGSAEVMFWRQKKGDPLDFILRLVVRQREAALAVACEQGDVCCVLRGLEVGLSLRRKFVDLEATLHDIAIRDESVADSANDFAYVLKQTKRVDTEPIVRVKLGLPPHEILDPPKAPSEPRPQLHAEVAIRPIQAAVLPSLVARLAHFGLIALHVPNAGAIAKLLSSPLKQFEQAGKVQMKKMKKSVSKGLTKGIFLDVGVKGVTLLVPEDAMNGQSSLLMVHLGDLAVRTPDPRSTAMRLTDVDDTTATEGTLDETTLEETSVDYGDEETASDMTPRIAAPPAYDERDIIRAQLSSIQVLVGPMAEVIRERRVKSASAHSEWHLLSPVTARVDIGLGAAIQIGAHVDETTVRLRVPLVRRLVDICTGYAAGCSRTASELVPSSSSGAAAQNMDAQLDGTLVVAKSKTSSAAKSAESSTAAPAAASSASSKSSSGTVDDAEARDIARRLKVRREEAHLCAVQDFANKHIRTLQEKMLFGLKVDLSGLHVLLGEPGDHVLELAVQNVNVLLEKHSFDLALKLDVGAVGAIDPKRTNSTSGVSLLLDSHPDDPSVWSTMLVQRASTTESTLASLDEDSWLEEALLLAKETAGGAPSAASGAQRRSALSVRVMVLEKLHSGYASQEADCELVVLLPRFRLNAHRDSIAGIIHIVSDGMRLIKLTQITDIVGDLKQTVEGLGSMALTGVDAAKRRIRLRRQQAKLNKAEFGVEESLKEKSSAVFSTSNGVNIDMLDAKLKADVSFDAVELIVATDEDSITRSRKLLSQIVIGAGSLSATVRAKVREATVELGEVRVIDHSAGGACYPLVVSTVVTQEDAFVAESSGLSIDAVTTEIIANRARRVPLISASVMDMSSIWKKRSDPNAVLVVANARLSSLAAVLTTRYIHTLLLFAITGPIIEEVKDVVDIIKSRSKEVKGSRKRAPSQVLGKFELDMGRPLRKIVKKVASLVDTPRALLLRCDATVAMVGADGGTSKAPILSIILPLNSHSRQALVLTTDAISATVGSDGGENGLIRASVTGVSVCTYSHLIKREAGRGVSSSGQTTKRFALFHASELNASVNVGSTIEAGVEVGALEAAVSANQLVWLLALLSEENFLERSGDLADPAGIITQDSRNSTASISDASPNQIRERGRTSSTSPMRRTSSLSIAAGPGRQRRAPSKTAQAARQSSAPRLLAAPSRSCEVAFDFAEETLAQLRSLLAQAMFVPTTASDAVREPASVFVAAKVVVRSVRFSLCAESEGVHCALSPEESTDLLMVASVGTVALDATLDTNASCVASLTVDSISLADARIEEEGTAGAETPPVLRVDALDDGHALSATVRFETLPEPNANALVHLARVTFVANNVLLESLESLLVAKEIVVNSPRHIEYGRSAIKTTKALKRLKKARKIAKRVQNADAPKDEKLASWMDRITAVCGAEAVIDSVTVCLPRAFDDAESDAIVVDCGLSARAYWDVATRQLMAQAKINASLDRSKLSEAIQIGHAIDGTVLERTMIHVLFSRSMTSTEEIVAGQVTKRTFVNALTATLPPSEVPQRRGCINATLGAQDLVLLVDALSLFIPQSTKKSDKAMSPMVKPTVEGDVAENPAEDEEEPAPAPTTKTKSKAKEGMYSGSSLTRLLQREAVALIVDFPLVQLTLVNDAVGGKMSPLVQLRISDIIVGAVAKLDLEAVSSATVDFNVTIDGYNRMLVVWEPVLETAALRLAVSLNPTGLEFRPREALHDVDSSKTNAGTPNYRNAKLYATVVSHKTIELLLTSSFLQSVLGVLHTAHSLLTMPSALAATRNATERASTVQLRNDTGLGIAWNIQSFDDTEPLNDDPQAAVLNFPAHRSPPQPHGSTMQRSMRHSLHLRLATGESDESIAQRARTDSTGHIAHSRAWSALSVDVGADACTIFDIDSVRYRVVVLSADGVSGLSATLFRAVVSLTCVQDDHSGDSTPAAGGTKTIEVGRTGPAAMVGGRLLWNEMLSFDGSKVTQSQSGVLQVSLCSADPHFVLASGSAQWQDAINSGVTKLDLSGGAGSVTVKVTRAANESRGSTFDQITGTQVVCSVETSDSVKVVRLSSNLRIRNSLEVPIEYQYGRSSPVGPFSSSEMRDLFPEGSVISIVSTKGRVVEVPKNFSVETSGVHCKGSEYSMAQRFTALWTSEGHLQLRSQIGKRWMTAYHDRGKLRANSTDGGVWQSFLPEIADPRIGLSSQRSALPDGYVCSFALRTRHGENPYWSMDEEGVMKCSSTSFSASECIFHIVVHDDEVVVAPTFKAGDACVIEEITSEEGAAASSSSLSSSSSSGMVIAPYESMCVPVSMLTSAHACASGSAFWIRFRAVGQSTYADWMNLSAMAGRSFIGEPRMKASALLAFNSRSGEGGCDNPDLVTKLSESLGLSSCYMMRDFAALPLGVRTWQLTPPLSIENQLPTNARILVGEESLLLHPLQNRRIYLGGVAETSLELRIALPDMGLQSMSYDASAPGEDDDFAVVRVSLDAFMSAGDAQFVDCPVILLDGQRRPLSLIVRTRPGRIRDQEPFATVQIFCPFWVVNITNLPLVYASKSSSDEYEVIASNSSGLSWLSEVDAAAETAAAAAMSEVSSAGSAATKTIGKTRRPSRFIVKRRSTIGQKVEERERASRKRDSMSANQLHHVARAGNGASLFSVPFGDMEKPRLAAALPPSDDAQLVPGWGVSISGTDVKWSPTPSLENVGLSQETSVIRGARTFPLAVTVHQAPGRFVLSKIVTISPEYTLVNETPFDIFCAQACEVGDARTGRGEGTIGTRVLPMQVMHISWSDASEAQHLRLTASKRSWSSPLSTDTGTVVVKLKSSSVHNTKHLDANADILYLAADVKKNARGGRRFHIRVVEAEQLRFKIVNDCTKDTIEVLQKQPLFRGGGAFEDVRKRVAMRIAPMTSASYTWDDSTVESPLLLLRAEPFCDLLRSAVGGGCSVSTVRTLASNLVESSRHVSRWAEIDMEELTTVGSFMLVASDGAERKLWYSVSVEGTTFTLRIANLISRCRPQTAETEQRGDEAWLSSLFEATQAAQRYTKLPFSTWSTSRDAALATATKEVLREYHARLRTEYEQLCETLQFEGMPLDEDASAASTPRGARGRLTSSSGRMAASLESIAALVEGQTYAASAARLPTHQRELAVRIETVTGEGDLRAYVRKMAKESGKSLPTDISSIVNSLEAYVVVSETDRTLPVGEQRRSRRSFVAKVRRGVRMPRGAQYKGLFLDEDGPQFLGMSLAQRRHPSKKQYLVAVEAVDRHSLADGCGICVGDILDRLVSSDGTEVTSLVGLSANAAWTRVRDEPRPCVVYVRSAEYVDYGASSSALKGAEPWVVNLQQTLVFPPRATASRGDRDASASALHRGLEVKVYLLNPFAKRRVELREKGSREAVERMLFFFGELDSTRLIQGDTATGDERITLLDVLAGKCSMPIPLAHSTRTKQENRTIQLGQWAKQVWLGRNKGHLHLCAAWQRATFAPAKCNAAVRFVLPSIGITVIDDGSRGGGAVVRSVLKRTQQRYQRAIRPRRELLRLSFRGTSFGGAFHSTGKVEVEFKIPWLQVETPLVGARRPILIQPMLDESEVEALNARGGDAPEANADADGAGSALPPALVEVLSKRPALWVTIISAPGTLATEVLHLEFVGFLLREIEVQFETSLLPELIGFGMSVLKGWSSSSIGSEVISASARDSNLSLAHCEQLLNVLSSPDDVLVGDSDDDGVTSQMRASGGVAASGGKKKKQGGAIGSRIYIESMNLHPISLQLTISSNSSSKNAVAKYAELLSVDGPLDAALAPVRGGLSIFGPMLTNLDRAPLTLGAFVRRNIVHSTVSLVAEIGVWYSTNVVVELYKLVGSADWLGNPVGLVSSISKGVTDLVYKPAEAFMVGPQEFTREFYKGTKSLMQQVRANEVETSTPSLQCVM